MLDSQKETIFNIQLVFTQVSPETHRRGADFAGVGDSMRWFRHEGPIHAAGRRAQREIQGHGGATDGPCAMAMQSILALQKRLRCIKWP